MAIFPRYMATEFRMSILGLGDAEAIFHVVEDKVSRGMNPNVSIVYDAFLVPASDRQWSTDISLSGRAGWDIGAALTLSEELIIAANVYKNAGWSTMGDQVVKKWPPTCVRNGPNAFRVTINYAPMWVTNFQISPQKTKKKVAIDTMAWKNEDGAFVPHFGGTGIGGNFLGLTNEQIRGMLNINTDRKGIVQGVDTFDPAFFWSERWTYGPIQGLLPPPMVGERYDLIVTELGSSVNIWDFRGFKPGSVLFLGGVGRNISPLTWEFDYRFSHKPNGRYLNTGLGLPLTIPLLKFQSGHTHVDMEQQEYREDEEAGDFIAVPKWAKLHKVHPSKWMRSLAVAPKIPFGYGTPIDRPNDLGSTYSDKGYVPYIGTPWGLPEWATATLPDGGPLT